MGISATNLDKFVDFSIVVIVFNTARDVTMLCLNKNEIYTTNFEAKVVQLQRVRTALIDVNPKPYNVPELLVYEDVVMNTLAW